MQCASANLSIVATGLGIRSSASEKRSDSLTTDYYDTHAPQLAATYESLEAERLNAWLRDSLPAVPACVLDIGAGSGRDAAWLASLGFDVVAVEPSAAMVKEAQHFHPDSPVHWIEGDSPSTSSC